MVSPGGEQCYDPLLPEDTFAHSLICTRLFIPLFSGCFGGIYFVPGSVLGARDTVENEIEVVSALIKISALVGVSIK